MQRRIKKECPKCNREVSASNYKRHVDTCDGTYFTGPNNPNKIRFPFLRGKTTCIECEFIGNNTALVAHYWRMHTEEGKQANPNKSYNNPNRKKSNQFISGKYAEHSLETRKKMSEDSRNNPRGVAIDPSLRSNRHKTIVPYIDSLGNNCKLESIWEWIMANELDRNNIKWARPTQYRMSNGRRYCPDFHLLDYEIFLDPKAFVWVPEQLEIIKLFEEEYKTEVIIISKKENLTWKYVEHILSAH